MCGVFVLYLLFLLPSPHQPTTVNRQPPTANRPPPTTNHQQTTTIHQPRTTNQPPPTANRHQPPPPPTNRQPPICWWLLRGRRRTWRPARGRICPVIRILFFNSSSSSPSSAPAPKLPQRALRSSAQTRSSSYTGTTAAPCSGTSTQARKRTHAALPTLEVRAPVARATWGKTQFKVVGSIAQASNAWAQRTTSVRRTNRATTNIHR